MNLETIMIVVPVYNEETVLEQSIRQLVGALGTDVEGRPYQVLIASNGSTDATDAIGRQLEVAYPGVVRLIVCEQRGRGRALREVLAAETAAAYLYIDVDLPCNLRDIVRVLRPVWSGADVVTSRRTGYRPLVRRTMTFTLRQLNHFLFGVRVSDSQCAVKALSARGVQVLVNDCQQNGWYLDTELVVLAYARGLNVAEVPIHWVEKRYPGRQSKVSIGWDSVRALRSLWQVWLHRQDLRRQLKRPGA